MITPWDDYFIHQTPQPILQPVTDDPNWIDRFWWGAVTDDGESYIAVSLGQYRTTMRMDAIVYFIREGEHRILKLARNLTPDDFVRPHIGPLQFHIVEPLREWTWSLGENPMGVEWDLSYLAGRQLCEFQQFTFNGPGGSDYHHLTQIGRSTGSISVDGVRADDRSLVTIRDRSWGVRAARDRLGMFIWIQHSFASCDVSLIYNERRDGTTSYLDGAITDSEGQWRIVEVGHDLETAEGRDVLGGRVTVVDERGETFVVDHQRMLKGFPGPVGYGGWAGKDHSQELEKADGYWYSVGSLDLTRPAAEIIAEAPIHIYEHPARVWLNGAEETISILSGGMTRSSSFEYKKRVVTA